MASAQGGRGASLALALAALGGIALAAAGTAAAWAWPAHSAMALAAALAALALAAGTLGALALRLVRLYDGLDRVRGDLAAVAAHRVPAGRPGPAHGLDADAARLAALVADLGGAIAEAEARRDSRLEAVLASLAEAVVVVTEAGLVSLVNAPAKALLDGARVAVGTSVYAALERDGAVAAGARARAAGMPVEAELATAAGATLTARVADLGGHAGTVYCFPGADAGRGHGLEHDLSLHDRAPSAPPPTPDTPLAALPVLVIDLETTGLDVRTDRVVSIGAVRAMGERVFRGELVDLVVDPGRPIPRLATAIHGITDAMVAGAPRFAETWAEVAGLFRDRVAVGHNVGFDLAVLRAEIARAGLAWTEPAALDLARLAAALEPRAPDMTLDGLAMRWGVPVIGRHTALGDALLSAELWRRALPRLAERGVTSLAEAHAFAARARALVARQRQMGW